MRANFTSIYDPQKSEWWVHITAHSLFSPFRCRSASPRFQSSLSMWPQRMYPCVTVGGSQCSKSSLQPLSPQRETKRALLESADCYICSVEQIYIYLFLSRCPAFINHETGKGVYLVRSGTGRVFLSNCLGIVATVTGRPESWRTATSFSRNASTLKSK